MNPYLVKFLFQIKQVGNETQFDVQWRVLKANNLNDLFLEIKSLAKRESEELIRENAQRLRWEFIGVQSIIDLSQSTHGVQVGSETLETSDPNAYLSLIESQLIALNPS